MAGQHVVLPCCHAQHHTWHCTSRSAKLIKNPFILNYQGGKKTWQDFLLSGGVGEMPFAQFSAFCCHIDPENTTGFFESSLDMVVEPRCREGKGAGPWLHGEPVDESRRVRTKPLE